MSSVGQTLRRPTGWLTVALAVEGAWSRLLITWRNGMNMRHTGSGQTDRQTRAEHLKEFLDFKGTKTSFTMDNNQTHLPTYDNIGFIPEESRPPPYTEHPGVYPALPQEPPKHAAPVINTHHSVTPGTPHIRGQKKGRKTCQWKNVLCVSLCVLLLLAAASILLWYFLYYECQLGRSCREGGKCLSNSQWCDGVQDCPYGEDESQCFRLYGTESMLQSFCPDSQAWLPVCAEDWDDNYGKAVCQQIGYRSQDYVSHSTVSAGSMASKGYLKLNPDSYHGSRMQTQLSYSKHCSARAVKLKCIECGQSSAGPTSRIVGGTDAVLGAWPWQVSLQIYNQHICGGSIISPHWILSAAHCFQSFSQPRLWTVYSGGISLRAMLSSQGNPVEKIISHEGYDPNTNNNDIALLKLKTPLTFSRTVSPVCLPNTNVDLSPVRSAWITGWGALRSGGPSPDLLNQAQVTIYNRETCNSRQVLNGQVTETMICAGQLQGGVDTCQGDSGGPLVVKEGGVWWLAGDTSWGIGCALRNRPGVYGNVTYFMNWVYEQLQNE
ncbi:uncharacterized protein V6R79_025783 [Siganus canaliculatus]